MTDAGWTNGEIVGLLTAVAALFGVGIQVYRTRGESKKGKLDSEVSAAGALGKLLADFDRLRDELETTRDESEDANARLDETRAELALKTRELASAMMRIEALERAHPAMLAFDAVTSRSASVRRVLNRINCVGIVITSPAEEGRFLLVNTFFAESLGMTPAEVEAAGWRNLIHPADLERAIGDETSAKYAGGETTNRYRHKDGHYVQLRWFFTEYFTPDGAMKKTPVPTEASICVVLIHKQRLSGPHPVFEN